MNIIFLDVDGVLNSANYLIKISTMNNRPYSGYDYPFNPKCLLNLSYLVSITNAHLVITSTWRKDEIGQNILLNELRKYDLDKRVIGYTRILHNREQEIKDYLDNMDILINYIILDDDNEFHDLEKYLIHIDYKEGLTKENVYDGIKKLIKR